MTGVIPLPPARRPPPSGADTGQLLVEELSLLVEQHAATAKQITERLDAAAEQAGLTDEQVEVLSRRLIGGCHVWSRRLDRASLARSWAIMAGIVLGALALGFALCWLALVPVSHAETCRDESGGRWCGYWVTPPTKRTT